MKKYFFLTLTMLFAISLIAQEPLTYTEVVTLDGTSKDNLFTRSENWFAKAFRSSKDVIQTKSKEDGKIIGKALFEYNQSFLSGSATTKGVVKFTVSVFVKEGRYKYIISDFIHESFGANSIGLITLDKEYTGERKRGYTKNWYNKIWLDIKKQIDSEVMSLITSLKKTMQKESEIENDNW